MEKPAVRTVNHDCTARRVGADWLSTRSGDRTISVRNLGKCYRIYDSPQNKLKEALLCGRRDFHRQFWALKNVSFDVYCGETLGIVGRNGSGKSTLLQIICEITAPTEGIVETSGRVSALLELGSGFHPDFTGKENVYMNASILGLTRAEIDKRYETIVAFADIGDFIDQPVRFYSSGMYVRLAFSVATNTDPQILVVDEALSVGDEMFQRKCFERIRQMKRNGCTILFVSHSGATIVDLCDRALLLDAGECLLAGTPKIVVANYHRLINAPAEDRRRIREVIRSSSEANFGRMEAGKCGARNARNQSAPVQGPHLSPEREPESAIRYESRGALISDPHITTLDGVRVTNLVSGEDYIYTYRVRFTSECYSVRFAMLLKTVTGFELGGASSPPPGVPIQNVQQGAEALVQMRFTCSLLPGAYFLNCGVHGLVDGVDGFLDRRIDAVMFRVLLAAEGSSSGPIDFKIRPQFTFESVETSPADAT